MEAVPWRKLSRDEATQSREVTALRLLGPAVVRLLAVRGQELLLERVSPGTSACTLPDDEATRALAAALPRLWVPAPVGCPLPTVRSECQVLFARSSVARLPADVLDAAQQQLTDLLAAPGPDVVLHGDLHHGNLLWSGQRQEWVAIDPHGLIGEAGYDVGPMLINPWERRPHELLDRRLELLADVLGFSRERLVAWGLVRAVLAEAWMVQDTGNVDGRPLLVAAALAQRL